MAEEFQQDARKPLEELNKEWSTCTRCELGTRRDALGGNYVAGEGDKGGVMFIGEGPGENEEREGRPFTGRSGKLLRRAIHKIGFDRYYISNLVACRSCNPVVNDDGSPRVRKDFKSGRVLPVFKDEVPTPLQIKACSPRLFQEIYIVDPVLIVALGRTAAEYLLGRKVSITEERGSTEPAEIPGAVRRPVLTDKKGLWARQIHGVMQLPTEINPVAYEVLMTLHPAYVCRQGADKGPKSPTRMFGADLRMALKIYERYQLEVYGVIPAERGVEMDIYDLLEEDDG